MGSFYGNVTLLDVALPAVREACPDPAYAIADGSDVVVYPEGDDIVFFEVHDSGQAALAGAVPDPNEHFGSMRRCSPTSIRR